MTDPIRDARPTVADAERATIFLDRDGWCEEHAEPTECGGSTLKYRSACDDCLAAEFAAAREEGRDAERERCAGLLDREASDADEKALVASAERRQVTANMLRGWHDQFARIAAAIRTGEQ